VSRLMLCAVVLLLVALTTASCGGDDDTSPVPRAAVPIKASGCSPVSYGGEGRPDFLIGTSTVLTGAYGGHGIQVSQALKMVLDERDWRAQRAAAATPLCSRGTAACLRCTARCSPAAPPR
jgi:hypothetical protein